MLADATHFLNISLTFPMVEAQRRTRSTLPLICFSNILSWRSFVRDPFRFRAHLLPPHFLFDISVFEVKTELTCQSKRFLRTRVVKRVYLAMEPKRVDFFLGKTSSSKRRRTTF